MIFSNIWQRNAAHFKQALKTGIAALLCLYITKMLGLTQGYWAAISAIIVLQSHMGATVKASLGRLGATAIGAIVGAVCMVWAGNSYFVVAAAITLAILCCSSPRLRDGYRLAGSTVVSIMFSTKFQSPWSNALERFVEVAIGIIVALVVAKVLWPLHARLQLRQEIQQAFAEVYALYNAVIERYHSQSMLAIDELVSKVRATGRRIYELRQQAKYEPDEVQLPDESIVSIIAHLRLVRQAVDGLELATRISQGDSFSASSASAQPELDRLLKVISVVFEQLATRLWMLDHGNDFEGLDQALEALDKKLAALETAGTSAEQTMGSILHFHSFLVALRSLAIELSLTEQQLLND